MLGPFEWFQTARVLFQLARFYPELTDCRAPLRPIPSDLLPLAAPGNFACEVISRPHYRATFPVGQQTAPPSSFPAAAATMAPATEFW